MSDCFGYSVIVAAVDSNRYEEHSIVIEITFIKFTLCLIHENYTWSYIIIVYWLKQGSSNVMCRS
jgi:hypothetical protein